MQILLNLLLVLSVGLPLAVNAAEAKFQPLLLVHGGAGDIAVEAIPNRKIGVKQAARAGYETLLSTGSVLDAVQAAVEVLELDPQFNAALGGALTWDETVEMDAAIMDGRDLNGGCVSVAKDIYHPIKLAREIMEKTLHRYLAGDGAMKFAIEQGFDILPEGTLVTERSLKALNDYKNSLSNSSRSANEKVTYGSPGTVGAVAIDEFGNIAAATSTGGITGKLPGRIGDSPILGGGTYADNAAAGLSATGHGETIMRFNLASRILALIEHRNMSAQEATVLMLDEMTKRFDETAGVISVDKNGEVGIYFTSKRMSWAYQRGNELHFGVDKDEDEIEIIGKPRTYDFY